MKKREVNWGQRLLVVQMIRTLLIRQMNNALTFNIRGYDWSETKAPISASVGKEQRYLMSGIGR